MNRDDNFISHNDNKLFVPFTLVGKPLSTALHQRIPYKVVVFDDSEIDGLKRWAPPPCWKRKCAGHSVGSR